MDRRTSLTTLFGRSKDIQVKAESQPQERQGRVLSGLDTYTGNWGYAQAAHLLRRSTFGATDAQIKQAVANGLGATVATLLANKSEPDPPVNYSDPDDTKVPIGETWVDEPYTLLRVAQELNRRRESIAAWQIKLVHDDGLSITEKMTLFWHNHFVTADVNDPKFIYDYIKTLRAAALGNFKQLVKDMTINPAMLRYLNGRQNTKNAPNENYARELLELFTIGKGDQAGPGDYTTFTETDVKEIARALTGWIDRGFNDFLGIPVSAEYVSNRHDKTQKQLSERFNNAIINDGGEDEYKQVVDIIFEQDEVSRFICRQLYIWFVYYDIDQDAEDNVIEPMAQLLRDNDYEVKPVLQALLSSEHFYDDLNVGTIIKNPIDFSIGVLRQPEVPLPTDLVSCHEFFFLLFQFLAGQQMQYFTPPSVAGWKAYYQEPSYYRTWMNSVTLPIRMSLTDLLVWVGIEYGGVNIQIDVLELTASIDDALNPNSLIEGLTQIFLPKPLTQGQLDFLKSSLIPGLPDFEWTEEYGLYLSDPSDENRKNSVQSKLRNLLSTMLKMPEHYLG